MRILFLSHQAEYMYGGEICSLEMMKVLKEAGHEIFFASPTGPYYERACEHAICIKISSKEFRRSFLGLKNFLSAFQSTSKELKAIIIQNKIDLVHATSLKSFVYALGLARAGTLPVLWHHHDIMPKSWMNAQWLKFLSKFSAEILVPSIATKTALVDAGVNDKKITVLRNAFPLRNWKQRLGRESTEKIFQIYMIGEISLRKGSDFIFPLLEALDTASTGRFTLSVVGEGLSDKVWAAEIKADNAAHCESGALRFLGRRKDVPTLLQEADALWVPSRQDPLPTVIVEAQLSGVPVLASPNGGIPEMIQSGENGYLCKSISEFVEKFILLKKDITLWTRVSNKARASAERTYSSERMGKELLQIYKKNISKQE